MKQQSPHMQQQQQQSHQNQQHQHQMNNKSKQQVHINVPTTLMKAHRFRISKQHQRRLKKPIQTIPGIDLCKCHFTSSQDKGIGYESTTKEWVLRKHQRMN